MQASDDPTRHARISRRVRRKLGDDRGSLAMERRELGLEIALQEDSDFSVM